MSIKIYSSYDEFKYEESDICDFIDIEENSYEDVDEDESVDLFFYTKSESNFIDSSAFYILSDLEDEENAEDISGYLGKFKKINLPDLHKVLFCII